jgi:dienelactone hydrolase
MGEGTDDTGSPRGSGDGLLRAAGAGAAAAVVVLAGYRFGLLDTGWGDGREVIAGLLAGSLAVGLATVGAWLVLRPLRNLSALALAPLLGALLGLAWLHDLGPATVLRYWFGGGASVLPALPPRPLSFLALAAFPALGAVVFATLARRRVPADRRTSRGTQVLIVAWTLAAAAVLLEVRALAVDGADPFPDDGRAPRVVDGVPVLPDPAAPGPFAVRSLTYGAGPNPRRPEFGRDRDVTSRTVDATPILPEWRGFRAGMREAYWGFGLDEAPLNGRVWLPVADGPRPLVLIVHGNHGMEDWSDGGYGYLAERLASHGFVTVSVDQNYINGTWSGDFRGREMAARAWLLLEHLRLWRDWQRTPDAPLAGTADLSRVGLVGHSRGGEAVSIAAAFARLPAFPDDATVPFAYEGIDIRALVAIAQVDQRYQRRVHLEDVDFFTIHGSHDADEPAYHGLRQMNRLTFTPGSDRLKAGVYVHRANHGQFNTGWGRRDYGLPGGWELAVGALLPAEDQRRAAQVYVHAFLRASLLGERVWRRALRDPRTVAPWLPDTTVVPQFQDASFEALADFEEDIDVLTATVPDGRIEARGLARWRELPLRHRDGRLQGSRALELAPGEEPGGGAWILHLPEPVRAAPGRLLSFRLSGSPEHVRDVGEAPGDGDPPAIPALRVVAVHGDGTEVPVDPEAHAWLAPPVRTRFLKDPSLDTERYRSTWEPVLQTVEIPLSAFAGPSGPGAHGGLVALRFEPAGPPGSVLWLDRIGWADGPGEGGP